MFILLLIQYDLSKIKAVLSTGSPLSEESFEFVYRDIGEDICLSSISGGTDINGCFAAGNPMGPVYKGELQARTLAMEPGDILGLMTDGVFEQENAIHEQFDIERVEKLILEYQNGSMKDLIRALYAAIRSHLSERGASFFPAVYQACGGGDPTTALDALWDLVWAGEVTNDTLSPLRAFLSGPTQGRGRSRPRVPSTFPPHAAGRWSLVEDLRVPEVSGTERATAWAEQLLERQGVVTRAGVAAEGVTGGFTALYPVLSRLEEVGRVRRGYFIEGLGGAQFALPGAIDRLRSRDGSPVVALASTDPANPYGSMLDWPAVESGRIGRIAGTYVVLSDGRLVAFLDGRRLRTIDIPDEDVINPAVAALAEVGRRHRRFTIETIDGLPAASGRWGAALSEHGFSPALRGLTLRR